MASKPVWITSGWPTNLPESSDEMRLAVQAIITTQHGPNLWSKTYEIRSLLSPGSMVRRLP